MTFDLNLLPSALISTLGLQESGRFAAEFKFTTTTQWRPPRAGEARRADQSKYMAATCTLQGCVGYKARQWEARKSKMHVTLVMNETPSLAALMIASGAALGSTAAITTSASSEKHLSLLENMSIGRSNDSYPELTRAHFERWVYKFSKHYSYTVACIMRV